MQQIITDNELDPSSSSPLPTPTSSSPPSSIDTPAFTPNIPSYDLPSEYVSMRAVLASLSRKTNGEPKLDNVIIPDLDLTMPVSSLLRIGTSRAHVRAEHSDGAKALVKGDLTLQEYIRWLVILWRVYSALELSLSEHARNPALAPTYHPQTFSRAPALARDITYLLDLLPSLPMPRHSLQPPEDAPLPPFRVPDFLMPVFTLTPPALATYITHLRDLSMSAKDAPLLLAHSYVRYLGDLSGGQYIASKTRQAFNLTGDQGLEFYKFEMRDDEGPMRGHQIKEWFREGMNSGVQNDEVLKERLVKEANLAFALNIHLFSLIRQTKTLAPASSQVSSGLPQSYPPSSSLPSTISTPTKIPTHNAKGQPLRYYERRHLEQEAKKREKAALKALEPKRTWAQSFERFSIFALAVGMTLGFSKYGWPWVAQEVVPRAKAFADQQGWLDPEFAARLLGDHPLFRRALTGQKAESVVTAASAIITEATSSIQEVVEPVRSTVEATASSISSVVEEQVEDWTTAAADVTDVINSVLSDLTATTSNPTQATATATVTETIHEPISSESEIEEHGELEDIASTAAEAHSATLDEEPVEDFADALTSIIGEEEPDETVTTTESPTVSTEESVVPTATENELPPTPTPEVVEKEESTASPVEDAQPPAPEPEMEAVEEEQDIPLETERAGETGEREALIEEDEEDNSRGGLRDEL